MDRDGKGAFPSERTLASVAGICRDSLRAAIRTLIADGWLVTADSGRKGKFGVTVRDYSAAFPAHVNGPASSPLQSSNNGPANSPLPQCTNGLTPSGNGLNSANQWPGQQASSRLNQFKKEAGASAPAPRC
jgi:hypothetical protein